jgi:hypothetical protein
VPHSESVRTRFHISHNRSGRRARGGTQFSSGPDLPGAPFPIYPSVVTDFTRLFATHSAHHGEIGAIF